MDRLIQDGDLPFEERKRLAARAFSYTSFYDSLIAGYFGQDVEKNPVYLNMADRKAMDLRYGENPHQQASLYIRDKNSPLNRLEKLQGKELSFNNILDLSMVYEVINQFSPITSNENPRDFAVIVKHQNPCGAAVAGSQEDAFKKAFEGGLQIGFWRDCGG